MPKREPGRAFLEAQNLLATSLKDGTVNQKLLKKSLQIEQRNANALYFYSMCLKQKGQIEASKIVYEKAYMLNPCYFSSLKNDQDQITKQVLRNLADAGSMMKSKGHTNDFKWQQVVNMYAKKRDLNTCSLIIDLFQLVKKEDKEYSAHLFSSLGITLYEIGDYKQSLGKYTTACALKHNEYRYYNNMAILQYIFRQYEESTQLVAKSLEYNPGYSKSMFILSFSLCKLGKSEEALKHILASIKKEPNMTMYKFKALTILAQYFPLNSMDFELQLKQTQQVIANGSDQDTYFYSKENQEILKSSLKFLKLHQKYRKTCLAHWAEYIQHLDDFLIKGHTDKYYLTLKMMEIQQKAASLQEQCSQPQIQQGGSNGDLPLVNQSQEKIG